MIIRLFIPVLLLSGTPCLAQSLDSLAVSPSPIGTPGTFSVVARMTFSLIAVIGLIWTVTHFLKRFSGRGLSSTKGSYINVLDRTYIAPKKAIYVVKIGNRALAVGVTDTQINTLADLDPEETLAAFPASQSSNGVPPFANILKDMRMKFAKNNAAKGEN